MQERRGWPARGEPCYAARMGFPRATSLLAAILIGLTTCAAYLPALRGGFVWDDEHHVTDLQALRSMEGLRSIWLQPGTTLQYYPLTFTSFWLQHRAWGLHPAGYHAVNIALHILNAWLLLALLRRFRLRGAWFAAALFALHPVNAMSVAWVTELKNVQSLCFALLAFHAYVSARGLAAPRTARGGWWYALALACFVAALLTKTATALLLVALPLVIWLARGRVALREWAALVPFAALGIGLGAWTLWLERGFVGASGGVFDLSLPGRVLHAGRAFWFYLGKLLWPHPLMFFYPPWNLDPARAADWIAPAAVVGLLALLLAARRRIGGAPLATTIFLLLSAPALVLVQVLFMMQYTPAANHWIYFGAPAVFALLAHSAGGFSDAHPRARAPLNALGLLALAACAALTWREGLQYRDAESLYRETLRRNPACFIAAYNLGNARAAEQRWPEAIALYRQALDGKPDYHVARINYASALVAAGDPLLAMAEFRRVLSEAPGHARAHHNLGLLLAQGGRGADALVHLQRAVDIDPRDLDLRHNYGEVLTGEGRIDDALAQFRVVVERAPDSVPDLLHLAEFCAAHGRAVEARSLYERALARDPSNRKARAGLEREATR